MQPGTVVEGKYELLRQIGEGGMGLVYEARNVRIGLRVALKFVHPELAQSPQAVARLIREAQAAAALGSDHIVRVLDVGEAAGGTPFVVMEYLEGENLADLLVREGPLDPGRAATLVAQACRGLEAAHARGFVHRDLKPENLFLTRADDGSERVKVLDFGIAKAMECVTGGAPRLTREGMTLGTLFYMAPEQLWNAKGSNHLVDVYALGAVLYELLTGQLPYDAETEAELIIRIVNTRPAPPSQLRPGLAPALEGVVSRARARDPASRFQSMAELGAALAPFCTTVSASWQSVRPPMDPLAATDVDRPGSHLDSAVGASPVPPTAPSGGQVDAASAGGAPAPTEPGVVVAGPDADDVFGDERTERRPDPRFVPRTMPMATPSTPFAVEQPVPPRGGSAGGRGGVLVFVAAGAALLVIAVLGSAVLFVVMRRRGEVEEAPASVSPPVVVRADAGRPLVASDNAEEDETNRWVRIEPPGAPVLLGISDASAPAEIRGFRPGRGIRAPDQPFEIQQHEVTWGEILPWHADHPAQPLSVSGAAPVERTPSMPATGVPWLTASLYCQSVGGRLPSEEEWEYAARGAARRPFPWGSEPRDISKVHAYRPGQPLEPVMTNAQDVTPGPVGIHDLLGNAQEWTEGLFREDSPGSPEGWVDDHGVTYRAVRGLPPCDPRPAKLPAEPAAHRDALCATGPCSPATAALLKQVGFRCARRVTTAR